jgi:hypothetical protein
VNLTDTQVLILIRANPGINLYQLEKKAKLEMPRWSWSIGKIQKSVERLKRETKDGQPVLCTKLRVRRGRACQELYCKI